MRDVVCVISSQKLACVRYSKNAVVHFRRGKCELTNSALNNEIEILVNLRNEHSFNNLQAVHLRVHRAESRHSFTKRLGKLLALLVLLARLCVALWL